MSDILDLGDWNAVCFECGRKRKASELRKHWKGYYVCKEHWEPRETQDFVRALPDLQTPAWVQPMPEDLFMARCTPCDQTAIPGVAIPSCVMPDFVSTICVLPIVPAIVITNVTATPLTSITITNVTATPL